MIRGVRRDGSFVVFTLPHSEEEFRLPAPEARHLGTELINAAWQIDEGRSLGDAGNL